MGSERIQQRDVLAIAGWSGALFGLLEGMVLTVSREFPAVLAAFKVSPHVLWVAPAVNVGVLCAVALGVGPLLGRVRTLTGGREWLGVYGVFVFLGCFNVVAALQLIHLASVVVLSLGLAVAVCRTLSGREVAVAVWLRRGSLWIPLVIALTWVGVLAYEAGRERWLFGRLPGPAAGADNVLLIVMDTVRHDALSRPMGKSLTPALDRISARGVRFENAWVTSSWSLASQATILTGRYPHEHGADWPGFQLNRAHPTLAEFFSERGYVTGAFSGNSAWVTPEYLGRGFLRFEAYVLEDLLRRTVYGRVADWLLSKVGYHYAGRGKTAARVNAEFRKFLDDYAGRPFFAYLCYMDVNQSFHRARLNRSFWEGVAETRVVRRAYEDGMRALDAQIGSLFVELERRGVLDRTVVVITSDHGESFGAGQGDDHDPAGHGSSLYPEQSRIPLVVVSPRLAARGGSVGSVVSTRQLAGTVTHLAGAKASPFPGERLPGIEDAGGGVVGGGAALLTLNYEDRRLRALVWDRWLYIGDMVRRPPVEELYDLSSDPSARRNLGDRDPMVPRLRALAQQLLDGAERK